MPPCFEAPPSLYDGKLFNFLEKGEAPIVGRADGLVAAATKPDRSRPARTLSADPRIRRA